MCTQSKQTAFGSIIQYALNDKARLLHHAPRRWVHGALHISYLWRWAGPTHVSRKAAHARGKEPTTPQRLPAAAATNSLSSSLRVHTTHTTNQGARRSRPPVYTYCRVSRRGLPRTRKWREVPSGAFVRAILPAPWRVHAHSQMDSGTSAADAFQPHHTRRWQVWLGRPWNSTCA
jgi:hypothetical protein